MFNPYAKAAWKKKPIGVLPSLSKTTLAVRNPYSRSSSSSLSLLDSEAAAASAASAAASSSLDRTGNNNENNGEQVLPSLAGHGQTCLSENNAQSMQSPSPPKNRNDNNAAVPAGGAGALTTTITTTTTPTTTTTTARPAVFQRPTAGISASLPMAERLPSRNVSFRSAEILTVGELYRYLYRPRAVAAEIANNRKREGVGAGGDTVKYNEIKSVRITGTLLCVVATSASSEDASDGIGSALYDNGTFLLVGDPLERLQSPKNAFTSTAKDSASNNKEKDAGTTPRANVGSSAISLTNGSDTPSAKLEGTPKSMPSSILRNKKTPDPLSTIATATPKTNLSKAGNGGRPMSRGLLLNNSVKKKFVYSASANRKGASASLSGGGRLLSSKFATPKRVKLVEPGSDLASSTKKGNRSLTSLGMPRANPLAKRLLHHPRNGPVSVGLGNLSGNGGGKGKNPKPEHVIQRHSSPIVPVWIGSSYNGDGLDGSAVGDLVMIMGEIVIEHCLSCKHDAEDTSHNSSDEGCDRESDASPAEIVTDKPNAHIHQTLPRCLPAQDTIPINGVKDAATSIARRASSLPSSTLPRHKETMCSKCTRFLQARFVKNANGTDMNLQKESLRVRREYMANRKRQLESVMPSASGLYSVGLGLPS